MAFKKNIFTTKSKPSQEEREKKQTSLVYQRRIEKVCFPAYPPPLNDKVE
jgi:hypothetical protein